MQGMEAHEAILLLDKEEDESKDTNQVAKTCGDLGIHPCRARTEGIGIACRRSPIRLLIATIWLLPIRWLLSIAALLISALLSILLTAIRSSLWWWGVASTIGVRLIGVLPLVRIPAHVRVHLS